MYLLNTLLGFLIAQLSDILRREKNSPASPEKFSIVFFVKDNYLKILVSLVLSIVISVTLHLNIEDVSGLFHLEWSALNNLVYVIVGAVPEIILQKFKRKAGLFQPDYVDGYKRS